MGLAEVSNILWRERRCLEMLVFKLEEEQLVLSGGNARWIPMAAQEVDDVLEEIRRAELVRAVQLAVAARELGIGEEPTLAALAEAAPEPWDGIFAEHRKALLGLVMEVEAAASVNRELLTRGAAAIRESLGALETSAPVDVYDAEGRPLATPGTLGILNESM